MENSEKQGDGRMPNLPGIYKLPGTDKVITTSIGNDGFIQADAFVQVGFVYAGPHGSDAPQAEKSEKK